MVLALVLSGECMAAARQEKGSPGDKSLPKPPAKERKSGAAALKAAENALDKRILPGQQRIF